MNAHDALSHASMQPTGPGSILGVIATSLKTDERRVPLHPDHFDRIPPEIRCRILIETGYGHRFGLTDEDLTAQSFRVASRSEVLTAADIVLIPKPQHEDLLAMRDGQTLWGWPHCVQDAELTQIAIDKRLTLIAFEAMNHWHADGSFSLHVFHANNELAGYCSVLHALQLQGITGNYGRRLSATVIGFGATARGAITALSAHGVTDVRVLTNREVAAVASPIHSVEIVQFDHEEGPYLSEVITENGRVPLAPFLAESDLVVNCTLQDPNTPLLYLHDKDLPLFRRGSLIVDVSCDEGMGFSWARPTTFAEPTVQLNHGVTYYAVDHTPSYLWNSASWENSAALLPFLDTVLTGPEAWNADPTISAAIEIRDGVIVNPAILEFQHRAPEFPHPIPTE
ncbi:alanine dehydrogenase [Leucobacter luti]|uniref:N(5)-(carboxyethyl)ornithine synthase n=1 Tax=Leucobacter luti TaxID=340320 RepID=UPI0010D7114D|nr:N(5)-(carboxyethyl)ornithine synthase [Leucobacter luti]MCW2287733.1 alanine dehydrogenase [Leucobacter luti]TCK46102.1 alanine dehydrogenase [Leucobacter luti]